MYTITEMLDGNVCRVMEEYDLSQSSKYRVNTSDSLFGDIYRCVVSQDDTVTEGYEEIESDLDAIFASVSESTGVDVNLLKAVAQAESGFDTEAVSSKGAMGIMQLMPSTCESYGVSDPYDAAQNITAGAEILSWMLDKYDGDLSLTLAAYNAGSGNVDKYGGVPPFSETTAYIEKVMNIYNSYYEDDSSQSLDDLYNAYASGYNRFL